MREASNIGCSESLLLNVVKDEGEGFGLITVVSDGNRGGTSDLSGVTLDIVLAKSKPLTEFVTAVNLNKWGLSLLGKSLYIQVSYRIYH